MPGSYTEDRIALQDVMLTYAAAVDDRDLEAYSACFADDVEVIGFGDKKLQGREQWLSYVWSALENYGSTQHMLGPQKASIDGDIAYTRNDVQAFHCLKEETPTHFILWATYVTTMQRIAGQWKIIRHELVVKGTETR